MKPTSVETTYVLTRDEVIEILSAAVADLHDRKIKDSNVRVTVDPDAIVNDVTVSVNETK